jgi:hypothetical protein
MNTQIKIKNKLKEMEVSVKLKLAVLWTAFMFLYLYIDYFHLFMPGTLQDLLAGKAFIFEITQTFLLIVLAAVSVPAIMIVLSVFLSAKANRYANIIVAAVYVPFTLFNLAGEVWMHMVLGAVVELIFLLLIIRYAWKWPCEEV